MSLRYAILGLLARETLTGYDLTKRFDTSFGFFWPAKHSQIYPELAELSDQGFVTFELVTQTSKPNKKVYSLTDAGKEALAAWVSNPAEILRTIRDPMLVKVWAAGVLPPESLLACLRQALANGESRLIFLKQSHLDSENNGNNLPSPENANLGSYLTLSCGLLQQEAYNNWCRWAIEQLEKTLQAAQKPVTTAEAAPVS